MKKRVKQIVSAMLITMMALQVLPTSVFTANAAGVTTGDTWEDPKTGIVYEYYDNISEYRTTEEEGVYLEHPTKPEYVFAGWWTAESVSISTGISNSPEAISPDKTGDGAWAKFVPEDVLTVKAQTSMKVSEALVDTDEAGNHTVNGSKGIKLRLVTSVDDNELYDEIGFKVKVNEGQRIASKKFFEELTVTETEGASKTYPKQEFDAKASGKFVVLVISGFNTVDRVNDTPLNVTPYWKTLDGTIVDGINRASLLVSDERANDEDGSKTDGAEDFTVNEGTYQYSNSLVSDKTSYKYFKGASDTVYLKTKYTTAGANNHFGITIRNGGEERQVYFDNLGVKVLTDNSKTASGLVDKASDYYNIWQSGEDVSVWAQRTATNQQTSTIATMLKSEGTEHTVIWAIENNVLYCSVDNHVVLRMPMEKLCEKWKSGRYYQLGVAAYNDESTTGSLIVKKEVLALGKATKGKLEPEEETFRGSGMTYEPITGSYLQSYVATTNPTAANVRVSQSAGTIGAQATIKWAWASCEWAYAGVYVRFDGISHQFYAQGHTKGTQQRVENQDATKIETTSIVKNQKITPFIDSTSEVTAIIQDGHLFICYNGQQAFDVNLKDLYPSYIENESVIELGFACTAMNNGLAYFQDVKSMTESEIQETGAQKWRFYTEDITNVDSVNYATGKIVNKGTSGGQTRVNFEEKSDRWEVTGTMYVDSSETTAEMQPQFFVSDGTTLFSPCLRSQGVRIGTSDYAYTSGGNSNTKNGNLTFNKSNIHTEDFTNRGNTGNIREKYEMDFKVVIANNAMYVWFESATESGKLLPAWRLPLTTAIYSDDNTTSLFNGFKTGTQYKFGLGNVASSAKGGYKNLIVKKGSDVDDTCVWGHEEFMIKSGAEYYDITNVGTLTHTDLDATATHTLELLAEVGANDDVYVEAVLKREKNFVENSYRLGFQFAGMYCTVSDNASQNLRLQLYQQGESWETYTNYKFTEEQIKAFEEGEGLKIGAARIGGKFYMYIQDGDSMKEIMRESTTYAQSSFNIKLLTWKEAKGAVFSSLNWKIGSVPQ